MNLYSACIAAVQCVVDVYSHTLDTTQVVIYFASAAVAVDSSRMTVSSSTSWSRFSPHANFLNGHVSTMWFMVCRHGKALQYLVDCCTPVTDVVGRQRLRSATQQLMVVPRHRLSTVGRRAFHGLELLAGRPPRTAGL